MKQVIEVREELAPAAIAAAIAEYSSVTKHMTLIVAAGPVPTQEDVYRMLRAVARQHDVVLTVVQLEATVGEVPGYSELTHLLREYREQGPPGEMALRALEIPGERHIRGRILFDDTVRVDSDEDRLAARAMFGPVDFTSLNWMTLGAMAEFYPRLMQFLDKLVQDLGAIGNPGAIVSLEHLDRVVREASQQVVFQGPDSRQRLIALGEKTAGSLASLRGIASPSKPSGPAAGLEEVWSAARIAPEISAMFQQRIDSVGDYGVVSATFHTPSRDISIMMRDEDRRFRLRQAAEETAGAHDQLFMVKTSNTVVEVWPLAVPTEVPANLSWAGQVEHLLRYSRHFLGGFRSSLPRGWSPQAVGEVVVDPVEDALEGGTRDVLVAINEALNQLRQLPLSEFVREPLEGALRTAHRYASTWDEGLSPDQEAQIRGLLEEPPDEPGPAAGVEEDRAGPEFYRQIWRGNQPMVWSFGLFDGPQEEIAVEDVRFFVVKPVWRTLLREDRRLIRINSDGTLTALSPESFEWSAIGDITRNHITVPQADVWKQSGTDQTIQIGFVRVSYNRSTRRLVLEWPSNPDVWVNVYAYAPSAALAGLSLKELGPGPAAGLEEELKAVVEALVDSIVNRLARGSITDIRSSYADIHHMRAALQQARGEEAIRGYEQQINDLERRIHLRFFENAAGIIKDVMEEYVSSTQAMLERTPARYSVMPPEAEQFGNGFRVTTRYSLGASVTVVFRIDEDRSPTVTVTGTGLRVWLYLYPDVLERLQRLASEYGGSWTPPIIKPGFWHMIATGVFSITKPVPDTQTFLWNPYPQEVPELVPGAGGTGSEPPGPAAGLEEELQARPGQETTGVLLTGAAAAWAPLYARGNVPYAAVIETQAQAAGLEELGVPAARIFVIETLGPIAEAEARALLAWLQVTTVRVLDTLAPEIAAIKAQLAALWEETFVQPSPVVEQHLLDLIQKAQHLFQA